MSFPFNPWQGLILISAELEGTTRNITLSLALDTGATDSALSVARLVAAGYDPALSPNRVQVTTGSGIEWVPLLTISGLIALGRHRTAFPILAHTLPPSTAVDGVLGLDFLRGEIVTIDFRSGQITLS